MNLERAAAGGVPGAGPVDRAPTRWRTSGSSSASRSRISRTARAAGEVDEEDFAVLDCRYGRRLAEVEAVDRGPSGTCS